MSWLHTLLSTNLPTEPLESLAAFEVRCLAAPSAPDSLTEAAIHGLMADRLGYAFAASYQAALRRLVGPQPGAGALSFCVTESGGGHPRAIETTLLDGAGGRLVVSGRKSFVTGARHAQTLLVVATTGIDADGRKRLHLVRVPARAPGVELEERAPTTFTPEISHARVHLREVSVGPEDVLPGDGYALYVKPFRTIEDLHVLAGCLGYLLSVARRYEWPRELVEGFLSVLAALRELSRADPLESTAHLALGGAFAQARALFTAAEEAWSRVEPEERQRWARDRLLLFVAETVRVARLEAAWRALRAEEALAD